MDHLVQPPFSKSVTTNVAHNFLKLVDTHFPKGTKLHAILNRNTIKVSYSYVPNIDTLIKRHNTRVCAEEEKTDEQEKKCNCRQPSECPLSGECLASGIVYEATVKSAGSPCEMLCICSTDTTFKAGYGNHKAEPTDWVSGLVLAEKKDGSPRVCIDPKLLNKALKRPVYPLPTMEDVLSQLAKAKRFSVCDVKNSFWHAKLDHQSIVYTTFATPLGRYRWKRLPFGIFPAPEIFQAKLDEAIHGLTGVARIVDDLLVWGEGDSTEEADADHNRNITALIK